MQITTSLVEDLYTRYREGVLSVDELQELIGHFDSDTPDEITASFLGYTSSLMEHLQLRGAEIYKGASTTPLEAIKMFLITELEA